ncbi:hypothetical protein GALMADRAFT_1048422 [Galerina marginata CBS 339.88]|uniref:Uncharacterized protein n=1 Tax=Galerina marginata (strain CBS 339.88) TaxID=685588 RepID=A0A067SN52_GALM3|nr:hypothetical protein GALMADRAFT_1048422 [Galerina marginata CBS 339.88]
MLLHGAVTLLKSKVLNDTPLAHIYHAYDSTVLSSFVRVLYPLPLPPILILNLHLTALVFLYLNIRRADVKDTLSHLEFRCSLKSEDSLPSSHATIYLCGHHIAMLLVDHFSLLYYFVQFGQNVGFLTFRKISKNRKNRESIKSEVKKNRCDA